MSSREKIHNDLIMELVRELTMRRHGFQLKEAFEIFRNISIREYLALNVIRSISQNQPIYEGKTYLKELSEHLGQNIAKTSDLVKEMNRKGLLLWDHDGDGSDGTYVLLTDRGCQLLTSQEMVLRQFYSKVIESFGIENMKELLRLMKQLDTVVSRELELTEGGDEDHEAF